MRKLPGGLLHNIISHGVAKLAEFLDDDITEITAIAGQSPLLKSLGDEQILDELRVLLRDKTGRTASFCFSTQLKGLNQLRLYGPEGSIVVDHSSGTVVRNKNRPCKSYLTYFMPAASELPASTLGTRASTSPILFGSGFTRTPE